MKKLLVIVFSIIAFTACGRSHSSERATAEMEEEACPVTSQETAPNSAPITENRKLIAKGKIEIDVNKENADSIYNNLNVLIGKHNGYKSEDNKNEYRHTVVASIPKGDFNAFVNGLDNIGGKMSDKEIKVTDVTNSYRDMVSAVKSKEAALEQYRVLLKRANTIADILSIQTKIDEIQEELDRYNEQKLDVERQVAYSKVEICFRIEYQKNIETTFLTDIKEAFGEGWTIIKFFVLMFIRLWPFILIALAGIFIYRRRKK